MTRLHSLPLLLAALALPLTACDSGGDDKDSVRGLWELQGSDQLYLEITSSRFTIYDYQGDSVDDGDDCYFVFSSTIEDQDGNDFTLEDEEGESSDVSVEVQDGDLVVRGAGDTARFDRSDEDPDDLEPECSGGFGKTATRKR